MGRLVKKRDVGYGFDSFVLGSILGTILDLRYSGYDARGIQVVVQCLALAKELGEKQQVHLFYSPVVILEIERAAVTYRDG